jgi:alcohol/geraniol dehydrogenase (NADP+)
MINAFAVMEKGGKLQEFQYNPGPLRSTEVEIGVEYCGICHSDISVIDNDWGRSQYPLVPGHEVINSITMVGASVTTLVARDLVGLGWHSDYCMK